MTEKLPLRPRHEDFPGDALAYRIAYEEWAKTQLCGACGVRQATHTWSGHPTCDECGMPGRVGLEFPRIIPFGPRPRYRIDP